MTSGDRLRDLEIGYKYGKWLQKLAALGSKLFSSIEVKHFSFADKAQALEWINN